MPNFARAASGVFFITRTIQGFTFTGRGGHKGHLYMSSSQW